MRKNHTRLFALFIVGIVVFMNGWQGRAQMSRDYRPLPKWEKQFAEKARRDVFPNDVRQNPDGFKKTLVVWTGIITNIEFSRDDVSRVVRLTATHHYFDWIEDIGIQSERFFLSPRGEGEFAVAWRAESEDDKKFVEQFAVDDMIIAYGYPSQIRNNVIGLFPTENLRAIKPQLYRTDILDYGRPGEPTKVLKKIWW
jgi:hypothetical protein